MEAQKNVIRRFLDEVWNHGRLDVVDEVLPEDFIDHAAVDFSPARYKEWVIETRTAFPDYHVEIHSLICEGTWVACRMINSGTHLGPLVMEEGQVIAPTGRHCRWPDMLMGYFQNGRPKEGWICTDRLALLAQLGVATL